MIEEKKPFDPQQLYDVMDEAAALIEQDELCQNCEALRAKLAAAEEREKALWDWGKNITNLMPILKNGFEQALNHKPGATKKVEAEE